MVLEDLQCPNSKVVFSPTVYGECTPQFSQSSHLCVQYAKTTERAIQKCILRCSPGTVWCLRGSKPHRELCSSSHDTCVNTFLFACKNSRHSITGGKWKFSECIKCFLNFSSCRSFPQVNIFIWSVTPHFSHILIVSDLGVYRHIGWQITVELLWHKNKLLTSLCTTLVSLMNM